MKKKQLLWAFLATLVMVAVWHWVAEAYNLYYRLWWFDIPAHYLGGACVGFGSLWLGCRIGFFPENDERNSCVGGISFQFGRSIPPWSTCLVVLVGIAVVAPIWELLEVIGWVWIEKAIPAGYIADTCTDLLMGMLGALSAWAFSHTVKWIA